MRFFFLGDVKTDDDRSGSYCFGNMKEEKGCILLIFVCLAVVAFLVSKPCGVGLGYPPVLFLVIFCPYFDRLHVLWNTRLSAPATGQKDKIAHRYTPSDDSAGSLVSVCA